MAKSRTISDVVREIVSALPETEEFISHGIPHFRVRGKTFANHTINHHGDGRVALNLVAPRGAQTTFVRMDPEVYYVPPYVGPKGWLGVQLDKGLPWETVCEHVLDAYREVAPAALVKSLPATIDVKPPSRNYRPDEIDPFLGKRGKQILKQLASLCESLPETQRDTQFGAPVWKAGKRTFVCAHNHTGRFKLSFWVGVERQPELTRDGRYVIAPYTGHNGWIDLDIEDGADWNEIEQRVLESYRHFALQRMLKALDGG